MPAGFMGLFYLLLAIILLFPGSQAPIRTLQQKWRY